jgi:adenine-specific DNA-methyltransferase
MYGPTFDHPGGWSWRSSAYVYSPKTGEIRSSDTDDILLWMVDTDYDAESFVVRHCYFAGRDGKPDGLDPVQAAQDGVEGRHRRIGLGNTVFNAVAPVRPSRRPGRSQ